MLTFSVVASESEGKELLEATYDGCLYVLGELSVALTWGPEDDEVLQDPGDRFQLFFLLGHNIGIDLMEPGTTIKMASFTAYQMADDLIEAHQSHHGFASSKSTTGKKSRRKGR